MTGLSPADNDGSNEAPKHDKVFGSEQYLKAYENEPPPSNNYKAIKEYYTRRRRLRTLGFYLIAAPFVLCLAAALILSVEARFLAVLVTPVGIGVYLVVKND